MEQRKLFAGVKRDRQEPVVFDRNKFFLYFALGSISVMFLMLTGAHLYARLMNGNPGIILPAIFHANTVLIVLSSLTFRYSVLALKREEDRNYMHGLAITFAIGVLFLLFQVIGWMELNSDGVNFTNHHNNSGGYLYMISGLHAVHILGGLVVLGICLYKAWQRINDPIKLLVFSTDPHRGRPIALLGTYWHFVDGLWVYLYVFFLLSSFF